ncbi:unnamed protein product [Lactuca saligna]|uniref:Uncharacterized protein n=1 Tax=Lactuca saligna TaxID=75948 RepID=A0AA35Y8A0_LACSI|nr:unnamed protein product [Lactuca saligna]
MIIHLHHHHLVITHQYHHLVIIHYHHLIPLLALPLHFITFLPKTDDVKNGENQELVMMILIPIQPEQFELEREDNQGTMVIIQFEPVSEDQPMPEADNDQFKTDNDDYEGYLDMEFMAQNATALTVVYHGASFDREIPQGTHSEFESDDDQLNPRKRKASFSGGTNEVEA